MATKKKPNKGFTGDGAERFFSMGNVPVSKPKTAAHKKAVSDLNKAMGWDKKKKGK